MDTYRCRDYAKTTVQAVHMPYIYLDSSVGAIGLVMYSNSTLFPTS